MSTRRDEGTLARQCTAGPTLYFNSASPQGPPEAVIAVLHGYADYGGRYAHVLDAWAERGVASVAIDMRGHGHAGGKRGFCEHFSEYLDDVSELTRLVEERAPGVPAFLFGHSFGGLVATLAALDRPGRWRALVLSGPYFGLALHVPRVKLIAGKIASKLAPAFGLPSQLRGADMTHDAARIRAYDHDPLIFKNATARWFSETEAAQARVLKEAPSLRLPLYLVMGMEDRCAKVESARQFFDAAGSTDKTWDGRAGLFHEVLNEPEWRSIADAIADFVLARKSGANPTVS
jgi:alpha-beta hydrolase superfamily lysophospholipase